MKAVGSSPTLSTLSNGDIMALTAMHLVRDKQWAYTRNSEKNINGENIESPAYEYAFAA